MRSPHFHVTVSPALTWIVSGLNDRARSVTVGPDVAGALLDPPPHAPSTRRLAIATAALAMRRTSALEHEQEQHEQDSPDDEAGDDRVAMLLERLLGRTGAGAADEAERVEFDGRGDDEHDDVPADAEAGARLQLEVLGADEVARRHHEEQHRDGEQGVRA